MFIFGKLLQVFVSRFSAHIFAHPHLLALKSETTNRQTNYFVFFLERERVKTDRLKRDDDDATVLN